MPKLLGFLVLLLGFAAVSAEAKERWPKARHCDALSWFCAGPRGLENRLPPPFFGVPSYARPDRRWLPPPTFRPKPYLQPRPHVRPDFREPVRPRRHAGPVICDPGRGVCFRPHPDHRPRGFAWRGLDDRPHRLYRPDRRPPPSVRFRPEWR